MTTETNTQTEPPISFDEKYKKELGVGKYTGKVLYQNIVLFGSTALGAFLGGKLGDKYQGNFVVRTLKKNEFLESVKSRHVGAGVGGFIGLMVASLILGYEHWEKEKSARLSVKEINDDISNMKIRQRTDPELLEENKRLREILDKESQKATAFRDRVGNVVSANNAIHAV